MTETEERIETAVTVLPSPVVSLEVWARRRADFNRFVNEQLRENIDYGRIPGVDKPTLLKPGAEKIMQLYGCAVELAVTRRDVDAATGHLAIEVEVKAMALAGGQTVGMGVGSCSTYESKYRYRWEWWNTSGQPAPGTEWERTKSGKWRKRVENRDLADQWNTVLKMAKKRAMVDLALTISGASERFTQDVEDVAPIEAEEKPQAATPAQAATTAWTAEAGAFAKFNAYLDQQGIKPADFYNFAKVADFAHLPDRDATFAMLKDYQAAKAPVPA